MTMRRAETVATPLLLAVYTLAHVLTAVSLVAFGLRADGWVLHPVGVAWYGLFVLAGLLLLGQAWRSLALSKVEGQGSPWSLVIPPLLALAALGAFPVSPMLGGARYQPYDPGDLHEVFITLQFLFSLAGCGLALIYRWPRLLAAWAGAQGMLLVTYPVWWARMIRWGNLGTPLPDGAMVLGAPLLYAVAALALGWRPSRSWRRIALAGLGAGLVLVTGTGVAHWRYVAAGLQPEFARQSWLFFAVQVPLVLGFAALVLPLPLYARRAAREWRPAETLPRSPLWPAVALLVWAGASLSLFSGALLPAADTELGWAGVTVPHAWLPTLDWAEWLFTTVRWLLIPYALLGLLTAAKGGARLRWTAPTFPHLLLWTGFAWLVVFAFYSPIPWLSLGGLAGVGFVLWTVWDPPGFGMMFLPLLGGLGFLACARAWELNGGMETLVCSEPHSDSEVVSDGTPLRFVPDYKRPLGPTARVLWGVATVGLLLAFVAWQGQAAWAYSRVLFAPLPAWQERWVYAPVDPAIASAVGLVLHLALTGLGLLTLAHTAAAWWPAGGLSPPRLLRLTAPPLALVALAFGLWWWVTAPAVIRTVPPNGATDVPRDTVVLVEMAPRRWSELLLAGSGMRTRTRYADTGDHIPGASGGSGSGFFFDPEGLLRPNALVEVVVQRTGERPYVLRFTTAGMTSSTATPMPGFPPFAEPIPTPAPPPTPMLVPGPTLTPSARPYQPSG